MAQYTEFGKQVKYALVDKDMTVAELARKSSEVSGMYVDAPYICRILTGQRSAPKIVAAMRAVLEMEE